MSLLKPYYQDDAVTIFNADCRVILPDLPKVDLVLTDPPYGIQEKWVGGFSSKHGWGKAKSENEIRSQWDSEPPNKDTIDLCVSHGTKSIVWGGNYFDLPPMRGWLVWNKPERGFSLSEAELGWTNLDSVIRVWDGPRSEPGRQHPTQKPLELMSWCIVQCDKHFFVNTSTILDPFMGSGTTLRAAKDLNRKAIGIEIEERYCEIAAKRMLQEVFQFT